MRRHATAILPPATGSAPRRDAFADRAGAAMRRRATGCAAVVLCATCAWPVLAQDTGTTGATHGNTASQGTVATPAASPVPAPGISHTISASDTGAAAPDTSTLGAGPRDMGRTEGGRLPCP